MPSISDTVKTNIREKLVTIDINQYFKDFFEQNHIDNEIIEEIQGENISVKIILQELFNIENVQGNLNTESLNLIAKFVDDLELLEKTMRHQNSNIDVFITLYENLANQFATSPTITDEKRESLNKFQEALFEYVIEKIEKDQLQSFYEKITDVNVLALFISKLNFKKEEHIGIAEELLNNPRITDDIIGQLNEKVKSHYDEITERSIATGSELAREIEVQSVAVNKITTRYIQKLNLDIGVLFGQLKFLNHIVAKKKLHIAEKNLNILAEKLTSEKLNVELSNFEIIKLLKEKVTIKNNTNEELDKTITDLSSELGLLRAEFEQLSMFNTTGELVARPNLSNNDKKKRGDLAPQIATIENNLKKAKQQKQNETNTLAQQLSNIENQFKEKKDQYTSLKYYLLLEKDKKTLALAEAKEEYKEIELEAKNAHLLMGNDLTKYLKNIVSTIEAEAEEIEPQPQAEATLSREENSEEAHHEVTEVINSQYPSSSNTQIFTPSFNAATAAAPELQQQLPTAVLQETKPVVPSQQHQRKPAIQLIL